MSEAATREPASIKFAQNSPEADLNTLLPGQLRVIKRNGKLVPYGDEKIKIAGQIGNRI